MVTENIILLLYLYINTALDRFLNISFSSLFINKKFLFTQKKACFFSNLAIKKKNLNLNKSVLQCRFILVIGNICGKIFKTQGSCTFMAFMASKDIG